jgi:cyclopropane fatty-acyl-phospholipid synthase-like methyltransferase
MYRFLDLSIMQTEVYQEVVERLKGGDKLLDLGCCFGQEIRQLVSFLSSQEIIF